MSLFKKKVKSILTDEDNKELKEIQRTAYMNKARELVKTKGEELAKSDIQGKQKKEEF